MSRQNHLSSRNASPAPDDHAESRGPVPNLAFLLSTVALLGAWITFLFVLARMSGG